jgi:hypothetical protein
MFDTEKYEFLDTYETAKQASKIKKILFDLAKSDFSDTKPFKLQYYACVNESLHNTELQGKNLDKSIIQCKVKFQNIEKYINDTNQHAEIKVKRCIKSKKQWARQFNRDIKTEEKGVWECLNRYHRRYLYYYPDIKNKQFSL